MNKKELKRMQIRSERYAKKLFNAFYKGDMEKGTKEWHYMGDVLTQKVLSRFFCKIHDAELVDLKAICHAVDEIISQVGGSCGFCETETNKSFSVFNMDAVRYYKSGNDRTRFESFNDWIAESILACVSSDAKHKKESVANACHVAIYAPKCFSYFENSLIKSVKNSINRWFAILN